MLNFSLQKKLHTAIGEMQLNINASINHGEFISLYGPSGAGKTSILRMLAGFMEPENGYLKIDETIWFNSENNINITPQNRNIGFVFQDYALFPNMSVYENIAFAIPKNKSKLFVDELLELTDLTVLAKRKIQTLSGGQQQRVALARAIAQQPKLLLLDEPLSAIDYEMRLQLQNTLLRLHKHYHLTTILVSHNIEEIIKLSDKIIHIENGNVQHYESAALFLTGIGYAQGLAGNILSIKQDGDTNSIAVFVENRIVKITSANVDKLKIGDSIQINFDENALVKINKT